jgi:hypothetical protein
MFEALYSATSMNYLHYSACLKDRAAAEEVLQEVHLGGYGRAAGNVRDWQKPARSAGWHHRAQPFN